MRTLPIGTRVFNHGDMANIEHWATVTAHIGGTYDAPAAYELTPDGDYPHGTYTYPARRICDVDKGNGLTRVVTEQAYRTLREAQIRQFEASTRC